MRPTATTIDVDHARQGLARVREAIAAAAATSGRSADAVRVVAAVKYVAASSTRALVDAGIVDLADNRLAQLEERRSAEPELQPPLVSWHYIGRLQSREAVRVATLVGTIHTLCTASAARRLDTAAREQGLELPATYLQVNVDGDPAKDGLMPDQVEPFLLELPDTLVVSGFMTMPAFAEDPAASRPAFAALRELRDRLAPRVAGRHELVDLSMGTSQDYAVAVEEGATHVRLGRILYEQVE